MGLNVLLQHSDSRVCTVMQNCDTVQSSCDNDSQVTLCSPFFRWKCSQLSETALSHLYALIVAQGNRTLNPTGSTLGADQGIWWMFFGGLSHLKTQYLFPVQTMAQQGHDVYLCRDPALYQSMDIRTNLFTERVVKHWDRVSRQAVE